MDKKELIGKLLEKLSEEDILEILGEDKQEPEEKSDIYEIKSSSNSPRRKNKKERKSGKRVSRKDKACKVESMNITKDRANLFDDLERDFNLNKEESVELKAARDYDDKTRKERKSFKKQGRQNPMIEVKCRICNEVEEVPAAIVYNADRYKCNDCSCGAS